MSNSNPSNSSTSAAAAAAAAPSASASSSPSAAPNALPPPPPQPPQPQIMAGHTAAHGSGGPYGHHGYYGPPRGGAVMPVMPHTHMAPHPHWGPPYGGPPPQWAPGPGFYGPPSGHHVPHQQGPPQGVPPQHQPAAVSNAPPSAAPVPSTTAAPTPAAAIGAPAPPQQQQQQQQQASGGAAPYLGARISLISNSNIRYEGTLYTIDPKEATVALQNVRCFGTENRTSETVIEASADIYEFLIFRGKDIEDLHVSERTQSTARPKPPADPAIMSMQRPVGAPPPGIRSSPTSVASTPAISTAVPNTVASSTAPSSSSASPSPSPASGQVRTGGGGVGRGGGRNGRGGGRGGHHERTPRPEKSSNDTTAATATPADNSDKTAAVSSGDKDKSWSGPGTSGYLNRRPARHNQKKDATSGAVEESFNFDSMLDASAKFDKNAVKQEITAKKEAAPATSTAPSTTTSSDSAAAGITSTPTVSAEAAAIEGLKGLKIGGAAVTSGPERPLDPAKAKYDSKKSFFDEISTDRDNRSGPPDMGAQRKTDSETFGDSARHYRPRNFGGDQAQRHHTHTGAHAGARPAHAASNNGAARRDNWRDAPSSSSGGNRGRGGGGRGRRGGRGAAQSLASD